MQQDQEKNFDDRIRRKLQEDEFWPAPPFHTVVKATELKGRNWLRGFISGDLFLLLFAGWVSFASSADRSAQSAEVTAGINKVTVSATSRFISADNEKSSVHREDISTVHKDEPQHSSNFNVHSKTEELQHISSLNVISKAEGPQVSSNKNVQSYATAFEKSQRESVADESVPTASVPEITLREVSAFPASAINRQDVGSANRLADNLASGPVSIESDNASMDLMHPLGAFLPEEAPGYTLQTRDYSHTPIVYRKPFTLDIVLLAERTMAYNKVYPENQFLNLNLEPAANSYGAGVLFNYHIVNRWGIKIGLETLRRKYNMTYNLTQTKLIMKPDSSSYETQSVILSTSRRVSETEVRLPFQCTYVFRAGKWLFEPAAGFTLKFKNLEVSAVGADEIPAKVISAVEVSNSHLVTAAWMFSALAGREVSPGAMVFVSPYFQTESLGKNSRQYYTGRAVSGAGVKAGIRFLFDVKD